MLSEAQRALVALNAQATRRERARDLARALGAEDLIVFVRDDEVDAMLPAPGFPQTLPDGRRWRRFLAEAAAAGAHHDRFAALERGREVDVFAAAAPDGSVLVLLGGSPREAEVAEICELLPLLAETLRAERLAIASSGRAQAAHTAATQAHALAQKLSTTRADLQRALEAAEQAARAKDEFLAIVSHELRTPLNAVLGWVQLILMGRLDEATRQRALESIERNAKSQARLIEDILDMSRIVTGRFRLHVRAVDISAVVQAALDVVRPAAEAKGVRLQSLLDSHIGEVSGDPDRLQQVFWNLLTNAVTHTPAGGRIFVHLQRVNSHLEISVADTGSGIEPERLPHVFDRFWQADRGSSRRHGGLGLGLSISRHLVELHGGSVRGESAGAGRGATFVVSLPIAPLNAAPASAPALAQEPRQAPREMASLAGVRVLVVDDEADVREVLVALLRQSGAAVVACGSAREALDSLAGICPDVLVSDIEMPGEDGYSLIRRVRAGEVPGCADVPAIALSAYSGYGDRMRALSAGFQLHVAKPAQPAELVAIIAGLVKTHGKEPASRP